MDIPIKTSQTEWSLTEGKGAAGGSGTQYGSETSGAPGPVTQPVKGEILKIDAMTTSQQDKSDHALVEGD